MVELNRDIDDISPVTFLWGRCCQQFEFQKVNETIEKSLILVWKLKNNKVKLNTIKQK